MCPGKWGITPRWYALLECEVAFTTLRDLRAAVTAVDWPGRRAQHVLTLPYVLRPGVHIKGDVLLGQENGSEAGFYSAWEADSERLRRKLQRQVPRLLSRSQLVRQHRRCQITCQARIDRWAKDRQPCSPEKLPDMLNLPHQARLTSRGTVKTRYNRHWAARRLAKAARPHTAGLDRTS